MMFTFCPHCGNKLIEKEIGDEGILPFCEKCDKPFFDQIGLCTITAVINKKYEIALVKDARQKKWGLIAGYLKKGESIEESSIREVKEEIGLSPINCKYISSFSYLEKDLIMIGFISFVENSNNTLSSEIEEVKWSSLENAKRELRDGSIAQKLVIEILNTMHLTTAST